MSYSSCLADSTADLILDASVFINLSASGAAEEILRALPQQTHMVDVAAREVQTDVRTGRSDRGALKLLADLPLLKLLSLDERGLASFERLVLVLDDGEAATIAAAASCRSVVVLDERKARRICSKEFPEIPLASTIDLFAHPDVAKLLGLDRQADAVHDALQNARMQVRDDQRNWVVDLIGIQRAARCKSIPRTHEFQRL